jgi:hypothetical protein
VTLRNLPRPAFISLFTLACLASSSLCFASSSYPKRIKTRWAISFDLPAAGKDGCLLCHSVEAGGLNTAIKPFATTLRQKYNLSGADDDALLLALDKDKNNTDDSDRDGFSDYEEIATAGTDPNDAKDKPAPPDPDPDPDPDPSPGAGGETGTAGGANGASGGAPGAGGAPAAGGSPEEPEPEFCTPELKIYPTAGYGCQIGAGAPQSVPLLAVVLGGLGFFARRARARRRL